MMILEVASEFNDSSWQITFYYVMAIALIIGACWAYYSIFVRKLSQKIPLKENIIYKHDDDVIENSSNTNKRQTSNSKSNNKTNKKK